MNNVYYGKKRKKDRHRERDWKKERWWQCTKIWLIDWWCDSRAEKKVSGLEGNVPKGLNGFFLNKKAGLMRETEKKTDKNNLVQKKKEKRIKKGSKKHQISNPLPKL
jgi:hypothetical protein